MVQEEEEEENKDRERGGACMHDTQNQFSNGVNCCGRKTRSAAELRWLTTCQRRKLLLPVLMGKIWSRPFFFSTEEQMKEKGKKTQKEKAQLEIFLLCTFAKTRLIIIYLFCESLILYEKKITVILSYRRLINAVLSVAIRVIRILMKGCN